MVARKDMHGSKYGMLLVKDISHRTKNDVYWNTTCECGNEKVVGGKAMRRGSAVSCGCKRARRHGMCGSSEYSIWTAMKRRCNSRKDKRYHRYGGRGISYCERWETFDNFFEDMGKRPSKNHSLNRIDNDGNYCPENCEWATVKQQSRNTCKNIMLTYEGKTMCVKDWSEEKEINYYTLINRLEAGYSTEEALSLNVYQRRNN